MIDMLLKNKCIKFFNDYFKQIFLLVISSFLVAACAAQQKDSQKTVWWRNANVSVLKDIPYGKQLANGANLLDLYLPQKIKKPLPLIVCIHGGGWRGGDKSMFPAFILPTRGYAVASINYRLSTAAPFPAQIDDCRLAIKWLVEHSKEYGLDPTKIGVWGGSAGGHLAALLAVDNNEQLPIKAVCLWCAPTDLQTICSQYSKGNKYSGWMKTWLTEFLGAELSLKSDLAKAASPITYINKNNPAFFIVQGDSDQVVPLEQSKIFYKALKEKGVETTLRIIPQADHNFYSLKEEGEVADFFDRVFQYKKVVQN